MTRPWLLLLALMIAASTIGCGRGGEEEAPAPEPAVSGMDILRDPELFPDFAGSPEQMERVEAVLTLVTEGVLTEFSQGIGEPPERPTLGEIAAEWGPPTETEEVSVTDPMSGRVEHVVVHFYQRVGFGASTTDPERRVVRLALR